MGDGRLSLSCLEAFDMAARKGSSVAAAKELGVSRAAVSISIKRLEEKLGQRLFTGLGRRRQLTPAGQELVTLVAQLMDRWHEIEAEVETRGRNPGPLPAAMPRTRKAKPEVAARS